MEAFFGGTVILLYFISEYAAEPLFVFFCCLPTMYGAAVMLSLWIGGCGRMISARRKEKRFLRKGVVAGADRAAFYDRCVNKTPPAFRAAYHLFLEGKYDVKELSLAGICCVRMRKKLIGGGAVGLGALASISVFLVFYFIVPIGETILRTAICAFHAAAGGVALHFATYAYCLAAEKAADSFSTALGGALLRRRRAPALSSSSDLFREEDPSTFAEKCEKGAQTMRNARDEDALFSLRAMLRDADGSVGSSVE